MFTAAFLLLAAVIINVGGKCVRDGALVLDFPSLSPTATTKTEMAVDPEDITSAGEDSSADDDNASQTTEDDPQVPQPQPPTNECTNRPPPPPPSTTLRDSPRYELTHTMSGHTQSISAVKFSPDGTLLASCCACFSNPLDAEMRKVLRAFLPSWTR